MENLQLGDLVYDNRYVGMIIGFNDEYNLYKVEWYAAYYSQSVCINDYTENRTAWFRKLFLTVKSNGKFTNR